MIVNMPNKEGVTLATEGKYCAENIKVVPTFEMSEGNTLNEFLKGTKTEITAEDLAGITTIRDYAFYYDPITSIELPETIAEIGSNAFSNSSNLKRIDYNGDLTSWCNIKMSGHSSAPTFNSADLYIKGALLEDLITPENITTINKYAFLGCQSIRTVLISDNVTNFGSGVFQSCNNLVSAVIGNGVTSLTEVFRGCTNLAKVTLGEGITTITWHCFSSCTNLMEVICLAETPPYINNTVFTNVPENCIFKVKSASVEAYKSETNWSVRADYIIALTPEEEALYGG